MLNTGWSVWHSCTLRESSQTSPFHTASYCSIPHLHRNATETRSGFVRAPPWNHPRPASESCKAVCQGNYQGHFLWNMCFFCGKHVTGSSANPTLNRISGSIFTRQQFRRKVLEHVHLLGSCMELRVHQSPHPITPEPRLEVVPSSAGPTKTWPGPETYLSQNEKQEPETGKIYSLCTY